MFKMTPDGTIAPLASFGDFVAGYAPSRLFQGPDGSLYGTVSREAAKTGKFKLTLSGQLTVPFTDHAPVEDAGEVLKARDGNSYGTTFADNGDGTSNLGGYGTVYKVSPDGTRTTLIVFSGINGGNPVGKLVQGRDGNLYGVTTAGGAFDHGTVFRVNLNGPTPSTSTASAKVNVPLLIHAVSNEVAPQILDAMQAPIEFFGKVVDESSNVVVAANVTFRWVDLLTRGFEASSTSQSDSEGFFSLRGQQGASLTVSVAKDGYYQTHNSQQTFKYNKIDGSGRFSPDPLNPVIFQLRKKGKGEPVQERDFPPGMGQMVQLRPDGTPTEIDLLKSQSVTPGNGQLKLEFWRETTSKNARIFDWKLQLAVPGGGLRETDDEFAFAPPEGGYQSSIVIDMPKKTPNWRSDLRSKYYVHLSDGTYGRIELDVLAHNGVFRIKSVINPSGSRNLEPMESKREDRQLPPGVREVIPEF